MRIAYLFDFDGTLVDTMDGFADIAARIISEYHPDKSFLEARNDYLRTSGAPFYQQCEILFPGNKKNSEMVEIFEEEKKEGFFSQKFSDDVRKTINLIRNKGNIAGVSSNNFQELIDRFVSREGLTFDIVLGYRDGFQKGRDHFDYVMREFSLKRSELVFVGDSLKDAEKAIANNISFIGKCGTFKRNDFLQLNSNIKTVENLLEISIL